MIIETEELREFIKNREKKEREEKRELKELLKKLLIKLGERRITAIYKKKREEAVDEMIALILAFSDYCSLGISLEIVTCPNCEGIFFPAIGGDFCPYCGSGPYFNKHLIESITSN